MSSKSDYNTGSSLSVSRMNCRESEVALRFIFLSGDRRSTTINRNARTLIQAQPRAILQVIQSAEMIVNRTHRDGSSVEKVKILFDQTS